MSQKGQKFLLKLKSGLKENGIIHFDEGVTVSSHRKASIGTEIKQYIEPFPHSQVKRINKLKIINWHIIINNRTENQ